MNRKSDSESEFEDAVDSLPCLLQHKFPSTAFFLQQQQTNNNISFPAFRKADVECRYGFSSSRSTENNNVIASTPSTSAQIDSTAPLSVRNLTTRHGRLDVLRNRMKQEFGPSANSSMLGVGQEDTVSQLSDCTSLASWGRNLLMERSTNNFMFPVVRPADSLSTRATPASSFFGSETEGKNETMPSWNKLCQLSFSEEKVFLKEDSLVVKNNELMLNVENRKKYECSSMNEFSPSSQKNIFTRENQEQLLNPPVYPPPPLPNFLTENVSCEAESFSPTLSGANFSKLTLSPSSVSSRPPPLPPRRTTVLMPKLPSAVPTASDTVTIFSTLQQQEVSETQIYHGLQQQLQQSCSLSPKRNVSEQCDGTKLTHSGSPYLDNYGVKRGHAKTNSLDRGLSLAKTMKSGPFPPPASSKSNSLNRDASPSDARAVVCEEDQRITSAHGVIQQLTFSVLSSSNGGLVNANSLSTPQQVKPNVFKKSFTNEITEKVCNHSNNSSTPLSSVLLRKSDLNSPSSLKFPSYSANKHLPAVGEESASLRSSVSTTQKPISNPHYENLTLESDTKFVPDSPTINSRPLSDSTIDHVALKEKDFNRLLNLVSSQKSQSTNDKLNKESSRKCRSLPRELTSSLSNMDSIDPVTRDVQRRMSLSSTASLQSSTPKSNFSRSGLHQMKRAARLYGTAATGFFRGAFRRAKTATLPSKPSKIAVAEIGNDGDLSNSDDEGMISITDVPTTAKLSTQLASHAEPPVICRPRNAKKGPFDFEQLRVAQELSNEHTGAVWCIKFSVCGRLFATAGQDNIVRVWVLKNYLNYFTRMRERYSQDGGVQQNLLEEKSPRFSTTLQDEDEIESLCLHENLKNDIPSSDSPILKTLSDDASAVCSNISNDDSSSSSSSTLVVVPKPFCVFRGHTADVLDLSWSPRNYFILSCGIDRTVKLWHLTRNECLCCFQHMDFVTCIAFMPKDDRYFISGSLDGKIRLWHIPEKKVALWNEVEQVKFITAITFVRNGKFVVVGTYNGRCFFYSTDLKYHTVIDVRSTRGKNARGHKITSLAVHGDKLLITSNDSRVRIYDLRDMDLTCKFKGAQIERSQIRASFSPNGQHIISGSEDNYIYIWRTSDLPATISVRKDRNPMWERVRAHNSVVTAAVFAPKPNLFLSVLEENRSDFSALGTTLEFPKSVKPPFYYNRSTSLTSSGIRLEWNRKERNRLNLGRNNLTTSVPLSTHLTSSLLSHSESAHGTTMTMPSSSSTSGFINAAQKLPNKSTSTLKNVSSLTTLNVGEAAASSQGVNGRDRNGASGSRVLGDVIVSADLSGSLKIFLNPTRLKAGGSSFFPH